MKTPIADWLHREEALADKRFMEERRERLAGAILAGILSGYIEPGDIPNVEYEKGRILPAVIGWADALIEKLDECK